MSRVYRHFTWLVFLIVALTASLPWWSHVPFDASVTFQTIMLAVLALAWLIVAARWYRADTYVRLAITLCWWVELLHQAAYLVVLAGAIWGAWWVSGFPWLHLAPSARLLFLLVLAIGSVCWLVEAISVFWGPLVFDYCDITINHYRWQRESRRQKRREF